jgi:hypothetical protein
MFELAAVLAVAVAGLVGLEWVRPLVLRRAENYQWGVELWLVATGAYKRLAVHEGDLPEPLSEVVTRIMAVAATPTLAQELHEFVGMLRLQMGADEKSSEISVRLTGLEDCIDRQTGDASADFRQFCRAAFLTSALNDFVRQGRVVEQANFDLRTAELLCGAAVDAALATLIADERLGFPDGKLAWNLASDKLDSVEGEQDIAQRALIEDWPITSSLRERSFRQDLTATDETLDDLLARLKHQLSRPKAGRVARPTDSSDLSASDEEWRRTVVDPPPLSVEWRRVGGSRDVRRYGGFGPQPSQGNKPH